MPEQIVIVPAPRELTRTGGYWPSADPVAEAEHAEAADLPAGE